MEAECRRGPQQLPLKADDWNRVELTLQNGTAVVNLNGTVVFERPMDPSQSTLFGIFRHKQQSTKVRSAVLTGDWPAELPRDASGAIFASLTKPLSADLSTDIARIVDDTMIAPLAGEVLHSVRGMQPEQAYERLKEWVLPSNSHRQLRLYYSLRFSGIRFDDRWGSHVGT